MTPADVRMNSRRSNVVLMLFPKPLEPIRQLRAALSLVGEPRDQQREGFGVTRDPQWSSVHRIESHVANQLGRSFFALRLVPAVLEAGSRGVTSSPYTALSRSMRSDEKLS